MSSSALEGIVPADHIFGTEFQYTSSGEIDTITRTNAGYGKVFVLDQLQTRAQIGPDHVVYVGDGSSDVHVMLHTNVRDGYTIAVSEAKHVSEVANRTVLSTSALAVLAPILEDIAGWERLRIRQLLRILRHHDPGMGPRTNRLANPPHRKHRRVRSRRHRRQVSVAPKQTTTSACK